MYDGTMPQVEFGEKYLIHVVHNESTYYANCNQSFFWGDNETNVLRQKSLECSIMVSGFIDKEKLVLCLRQIGMGTSPMITY